MFGTGKDTAIETSLPVELTRFIGREHELATLRQLVGTSRLLTLTGAGGSGKSRLALELVLALQREAEAERRSPTGAAAHAGAPEAITWVELAPLIDAAYVPAHILAALAGAVEPRAVSAHTIASAIGERDVLLVLDNCEHLVDACAQVVDALLRACPGLRVLATSREALGVRGERAWLVPPLAVPQVDGQDASPCIGELERWDAVRLFVDRAGDVVPGFQLGRHNACAIVDICARLDGIPLAIELAAARVRHMSPDQIRDRLTDSLGLLTTGARNSIPRHRTLRAAIDWSHDLLPDIARVVLRRLAVFRGGFTLEAVEAVVTGAGASRSDSPVVDTPIICATEVLDLVALLVDRSMVSLREDAGTARYQLLETIRQYAEQRLRESGEEQQVRETFALHIAGLVESLEPAFTAPGRRVAFEQLSSELDNIREALHWSRANAPALHVRLVGMLWWFWFSTRHWKEAEQWISAALTLPVAAEPQRPRAALLFAAGALAALRAQPALARAPLEEAASIANELGDHRLEAFAFNYLGMSHAQIGSPETFDYCERAERYFRATGDAYGLRLSLVLLALAHHAAGRTDEAMAFGREGVDIARRFGQDRELAIALQSLAGVLLDEGEHVAAEALILDSLRALVRDPWHLFIGRGIECLAVATARRAPREAALRLGMADAIREHLGANRFAFDQRRVESLEPVLRAALGVEAFDTARAEGAAVSPNDALRLVIESIDREQSAGARLPSRVQPMSAEAPSGVQPMVAASVGEPAVSSNGDAAIAVDLHVLALGPFEVWVHGQAVEDWPYAKPKELLVYLLCHPKGATRVEIGSAMWPEATPAQSRNSFHVTLHHLRRALGHADWIVHEDERYSVSRRISIDFDVARFEREVGRILGNGAKSTGGWSADTTASDLAAMQGVLALYRDHLLAGESAGPWRDDLSDKLRRLYCDAALAAAAELESRATSNENVTGERSSLEQAIALYNAVVAREPLHEEAQRRFLLCLVRAGDRPRALRHYERFRALLENELDMTPEAETVTLYERIKSAEVVV